MQSFLAWMLAVLLLISGRAAAGQTLTAPLNPPALNITTAIAGSQPSSVSVNSTYTVTTPTPNKTYKITAELTQAMPAGVTLTVTFAAPPGGTSAGPVVLTTLPQDVVTGIPRNTVATPQITYQLSATVTAGPIGSTNRSVTLTIVQFP